MKKNTNPKVPRGWVTPEEGAQLIDANAATLRLWCGLGYLGEKVGPGRGRWRIRIEDLKRVVGAEWVRETVGE